jgi:hypothetical protein
LHRRQRSRGKQQETKFDHVMWVPRETAEGVAINKYGLGRNVAALAGRPGYIFAKHASGLELSSSRIQPSVSTELRMSSATVGRGAWVTLSSLAMTVVSMIAGERRR